MLKHRRSLNSRCSQTASRNRRAKNYQESVSCRKRWHGTCYISLQFEQVCPGRTMLMTGISVTLCGPPRMIRGLGAVAVLVCGLLFVSDASASVTNTLLTGSTGTVTFSLNSMIFNNDPAALPGGTCTTTLGRGCNSDVTTNTTLSFV